jgi:hypothetical protein
MCDNFELSSHLIGWFVSKKPKFKRTPYLLYKAGVGRIGLDWTWSDSIGSTFFDPIQSDQVFETPQSDQLNPIKFYFRVNPIKFFLRLNPIRSIRSGFFKSVCRPLIQSQFEWGKKYICFISEKHLHWLGGSLWNSSKTQNFLNFIFITFF